MNVCLDETGNYGAVSGINYEISRLPRATNLGDTSVTNEQIATNDGVRVIHRYEGAVLNEG